MELTAPRNTKHITMSTKSILLLLGILTTTLVFGAINSKSLFTKNPVKPEECVFNTVFGEIPLDTSLHIAVGDNVKGSIQYGLDWLEKAQHKDGGWGAGFHSAQHIRDPHKVPADPATTAMVSMALLRTGANLEEGRYSQSLSKATDYLLEIVENAVPDGRSITHLKGTQIQNKLGENIDLVLTLQYLTNLLDKLDENHPKHERINNLMAKSVDIVQTAMDEEGKVKGAGWAGVLQSAFATNALESASDYNAGVDRIKLNKAKSYQSSNYNPVSKRVETKDGAGVMLYAVSGSLRANAKRSRTAKEIISKAKSEGKITDDRIIYENFRKAGISESEALEYEAANNIYESAKITAQDKNVMKGFGNNGGEEFLSFLQTGESLVVNKDDAWHKWYEDISQNLLSIQNQDGSWNGHHCITSPVFCTATCVLILSINNDIEELSTYKE